MSDIKCLYCEDKLDDFAIKICDLEFTRVYLFKEQSHPGRCIIANKRHVEDISELSEIERNGFFAEMSKLAEAILKEFKPDKINYGAFGDTVRHLHFHLVPKYKDQFEWNGTFAMNPKQQFLSDEEYNKMIETIKTCISSEV